MRFVQYKLLRYKTADGYIPYTTWLEDLDKPAFARVQAYVDRMKAGNFGKFRSIGASVVELKIDFGPGYRVYYLRDKGPAVVLLCGGDKGSQ